jgi:hypothetical protein
MARKEKGYSHKKADVRKARKREEAETRQLKYNRLSRADKITLVTNRGGSQRELARLIQLKEKQPAQAPVATVTEKETSPRRTSKSEVVRAAKTKRPSRS